MQAHPEAPAAELKECYLLCWRWELGLDLRVQPLSTKKKRGGEREA